MDLLNATAHGTKSAVIHGHDKTFNQQCMHARSGSPPPDDNRLTSNYAKFGLAQLHIL